MRKFIERLLRRINEYLMRKFPPVPVRKDLIPEDDGVITAFPNDYDPDIFDFDDEEEVMLSF